MVEAKPANRNGLRIVLLLLVVVGVIFVMANSSSSTAARVSWPAADTSAYYTMMAKTQSLDETACWISKYQSQGVYLAQIIAWNDAHKATFTEFFIACHGK